MAAVTVTSKMVVKVELLSHKNDDQTREELLTSFFKWYMDHNYIPDFIVSRSCMFFAQEDWPHVEAWLKSRGVAFQH